MYKSGKVAMQIDFILFQRTITKLVKDVKVIPGEEVALQHQLLVCDMRIDVPPKSKCKFIPCLKVWKLKYHHEQLFPDLQLTCKWVCRCSWCCHWRYLEQYQDWPARQLRCVAQLGPITGIVKPGGGMMERGKGHCCQDFKAWKTGKGTRASYNTAKCISRQALHHARQEANKKAYESIDPKSSEVYHLVTCLEERYCCW